MIVTVYSTPACPQCRMTKLKLTKNGIRYESVDLTKSPADEAAVKELGFTQAPVVIANVNGEDLMWQGFRPDLIDQVKQWADEEEGAA